MSAASGLPWWSVILWAVIVGLLAALALLISALRAVGSVFNHVVKNIKK